MEFTATKAEQQLIDKILERLFLEGINEKSVKARAHWEAIMNACHSNGCPLDLEKLLSADDLDFYHDMYGIKKHIDYNTGILKDFFEPRCARRGASADQPALTKKRCKRCGDDDQDAGNIFCHTCGNEL